MHTVVDILQAIATLAAAVFWGWASIITVPDNVDTFISVLPRIGRARGAFCACLAAICALVLKACG
jgi:hypothetical protein